MNLPKLNENADPHRLLGPAALVLAALLVPLRILAGGWMPQDDALRHAAFAVSGKAWTDILVLRPEVLLDQSPGWHALLRALHHLFGWNAEVLVLFSSAFLLLAFLASGLPWVRRWEAWFLAVLLATLSCDWTLLFRFTVGRPFILTTAAGLLLVEAYRPKEAEDRFTWREPAVAMAVALCTWIHGSWYLFGLPLVALALAGRRRALLRAGLAVAAGVVLGACLTGAPLAFLGLHLGHLASAFLRTGGDSVLVMEFQPGTLNIVFLLAAGGVALGCRARLGPDNTWRDPLLWQAFLGWLLGFSVARFASDWALPALTLWIAQRLDEAMVEAGERWQDLRLGACLATAAAFFMISTSRIGSHWDPEQDSLLLNAARPGVAEWLPGEGGVLYSNSMRVFMQTFYQNPRGPWRYVLGYEPGMMTEADYAVWERSRRGVRADKAFAPWIARMGPADRLVLLGPPAQPPPLPALEWGFIGPDKWLGRKRR